MSMSDEAHYKSQRYKTSSKKPAEKKSFVETFIPRKTDNKKEIISKVIVLIALVVLIVCGIVLGIYFYEMYEAKKNNNIFKLMYEQSQSDSSSGNNDVSYEINENGEIQRPPLVTSEIANQFLEINKDTVGYLRIPGIIDEVVVQGTDNEYYLNHNFYDNQRQCGTIFADKDATVSTYPDLMSDNIVLYGHNQKDGTMFGNLDMYKWDPSYWLKNPFIYFDNNYFQGTYVIVSSFVTNTEPEHDNGNVFDYHNFADFQESGRYTYENFAKEITERSTIITGVDIEEGDKFIMLSTCSYEWSEARHVIVARRLRAGETTDSFDLTLFQKNPNPKWPAIYYKYNGGEYIADAE